MMSGNWRALLANCVQYEPGWEGEAPLLQGKQEADGQGQHFSGELDTCLAFSSMSKV